MEKEYLTASDRSKAIGIALSSYILLRLVTSFLLSAFAGAFFDILSLVFKVVRFGVPLFIYCKITGYKPRFSENAEKKRKASHETAIEFVFAFSFTAVSVSVLGTVTEKLLLKFGADITQNRASGDAWSLTVMFIGSVFLAAVTEETLFRGAVMDALAGYGRATKIFTSAFLFALMHCDLLQIPYAFVAGAIISAFFVRTGSLFFAVALHFSSNALTYIFEILRIFVDEKNVETVSNTVFCVLSLIAVVGVIYFLARAKRSEADGAKTNFESIKTFFSFGTVTYAVTAVLIALINIF